MAEMKTGVCFGAFDPVHIGHIFLFQRAKRLCSFLIVAAATDDRIRKIKEYEPCFTYEDRAKALNEIGCVDLVIPYIDKQRIAEWYKPDVIFVGSDWKNKEWDGAGLGIKIIYLDRTQKVSGTQLRCF